MSAADRGLRVVFFGDSICAGQGISIHHGWVTRISARLAEVSRTLGREVLVVNASVNGDTTRLALERMPYDIQSHPLEIMIVQFGMNDCNIWQTDRGCPRVSPRAFAANLWEIIDRGLAFGASRIFLNTNHPSGRSTDNLAHSDLTYQEQNRRYNEIIRSVAAERHQHVTLIDIEKAFQQHIGDSPALLHRMVLPDLLHLSDEGHDLYYSLVQPQVERAVLEMLEAGSGNRAG